MSITEKEQKTKPLLVRVTVTTGAKQESVGIGKGRLRISVRAPRKENRANLRVRELVALHFSVPVRAVRITSGHQQASKTLEVKGYTHELQR